MNTLDHRGERLHRLVRLLGAGHPAPSSRPEARPGRRMRLQVIGNSRYADYLGDAFSAAKVIWIRSVER
jgi:hypothetical protein